MTLHKYIYRLWLAAAMATDYHMMFTCTVTSPKTGADFMVVVFICSSVLYQITAKV